jgi:hypothetical protein
MNGNKALTAAFTSVEQNEIVWQNSSGSLVVWFFVGSAFINSVALRNNQPAGIGWAARAVGDLDGDGQPDILFQHNNGTLAAWLMNGNNFRSSLLLRNGQSAGGWRVVGVGDFNGDGSLDILFQNPSSVLALWFMNGTQFASAALVNGGRAPGYAWRVAAIADFNGDGQSDILWQNANRVGAVWLMSGTQTASTKVLRNGISGPSGFRIISIADFDGNNTPDLLWRHDDGRLLTWLMDGTDYLSTTTLRNGKPVAQGLRILGSK